MYAVIELKWHQYIVEKWNNIIVDKMEWNKWDKVEVKEVLSVFDEKWEKVEVGRPYLEKTKVVLEILETKRWEKIEILKFKRKNRYKRKIGFRSHQTVLEVKDIKVNG